ncbi:uncharacterized protein LOC134535366 [Bacillus rossius redtenbacheri]|uniref:uncharacterized protein LOC134535366 n=1 Tax=Bacillus rossius redtenbacheri TaxID=93214 RepID=UPI002FDE00C2
MSDSDSEGSDVSDLEKSGSDSSDNYNDISSSEESVLITAVFGEELHTIPEKQKTTATKHLRTSDSVGNHTRGREKRKLVDVKTEGIDHMAEASQILGPSISTAYLGDYGGYGEQGYGGLGGQNYGLEKGAGGFYGNQNTGISQGEIGFYGAGGSKGASNLASTNRYGGSNAAKKGSGASSGYYGDAAGARRGHNVGNAYYGDQAYSRNGAAAQGVGSRAGHRKGHHSTGFHNTYHKDESGKTSTFYDDGADEGGHYSYDARDGAYKDAAGNVGGGGFQDGAYQGNQQARQGNYGTSAAFDAQQGNKDILSNGQYLNDQQKYGVGRSANKYGLNTYEGQGGGGGAYYKGGGGGYNYGQNAGVGGFQNGPAMATGGYLAPATGYGFYDQKASTLHPQQFYPAKAKIKEKVTPSNIIELAAAN